MTIRKDGRHLISVALLPDFYHQVVGYCKRNDLPVSVWVRELIRRELASLGELK